MSFFCDDLNAFGLRELGENLSIHYVENHGLVIFGNIKISNFSETEIVIKKKQKTVKISGEDLIIKTMSKGEIVVAGKVLNIDFGGKNYE